jgi:tRNA(His) 5'-end guanylyltransferase
MSVAHQRPRWTIICFPASEPHLSRRSVAPGPYRRRPIRLTGVVAGPVITLTFVRGGGEVVFKNTYESLSVDGRCVPITERTSLT